MIQVKLRNCPNLRPRKTPVQMFLSSQRRKSCASDIEEQVDDTILNKKIFKLGDKEILVFVSKSAGKIKVHLVTNLEESTILHCALAKQPGEWSELIGKEWRENGSSVERRNPERIKTLLWS